MFRRDQEDGSSRSAEDRARAAAARAARRAAREGRPIEPPPSEVFLREQPPSNLAPGDDARPAGRPPARAEAGVPPAEDPGVAPGPPGPPVPERAPGPPVPERAPAPVPKLVAEGTDPLTAPAAVPAPLPPPPAAADPPAGPVDVPPPAEDPGATVEADVLAEEPLPDLPPQQPRRERRTPAAARGGATPRGARRPLPPRGPRQAMRPRTPAGIGRGRPGKPPRPALVDDRRAFTARRVLTGLAALFVVAFLVLVNGVFEPFKGEPDSEQVEVRIPENSGVSEIGQLLADRDVVSSKFFFALNAAITGRRDGLRPGTYTLPTGLSHSEALDRLQAGPKVTRKVVKTFDLTIAEGRSRREVARLLRKVDDLDGDYLQASAPTRARLRAVGAPKGTDTLEGFLFPATYKLPVGASAKRLVDDQLQAFADNTSGISYKRAKSKNLTRYEVLIIASMVEREAQLDKERRIIASVIYNRLREGIPLGIDATIRYERNNWTRPLRESELALDTPYNTRLRRGLPPTPIGNPGVASIKAAAAPADTDFLFYVVKPNTCGEHAFSETDAQFEADVAKYNSAREAKGGKSPTSCPD